MQRPRGDRRKGAPCCVRRRSIGKGHHQAIFVDGEAIIFNGETNEIVARMPAAECVPGGGVARNEPEEQPGADHPNRFIYIANP
jgi:hypothetical protein